MNILTFNQNLTEPRHNLTSLASFRTGLGVSKYIFEQSANFFEECEIQTIRSLTEIKPVNRKFDQMARNQKAWHHQEEEKRLLSDVEESKKDDGEEETEGVSPAVLLG